MTTRIPAAELDRIEEVCSKATPGPWQQILAPIDEVVVTTMRCAGICTMSGVVTIDDMRLTAESRTALPRLVAELRKAYAEVDNKETLRRLEADYYDGEREKVSELKIALAAKDAEIERLNAELTQYRELRMTREQRVITIRDTFQGWPEEYIGPPDDATLNPKEPTP